jgi:DNA replication protein DnaC
MTSMGPALKVLMNKLVVLPDDLQCPECKYFAMSSPEAIAIVRESGGNVQMATCKCPDRKAQANREADGRRMLSNLPHQGPDSKPRTLDMFRRRDGTKDAVEAMQAFIALEGPKIVTLIGDYGTGKSHLAEAVGREWLHRGQTVRYDQVGDLLDELRGTFSRDEEETVHSMMEFRQTRSLLILDDLGATTGTKFAHDQLTALVDHRYRTDSWLLVTTNLSREEMDKHAGERVAERLWDQGPGCSVVLLDCTNFRKERR